MVPDRLGKGRTNDAKMDNFDFSHPWFSEDMRPVVY